MPGIPTEVHVEVHEICKPLDLPGPGCLTARQISKWLKVDRYLTPGPQESMQEGCVAQLIIGIVGDVLRHVAIQILKRQGVGWISSDESLKFFGGLRGPATGRSDASEFRVLGPQITLNSFSPQRELQKCNIAFRKPARTPRGLRIALSLQ